MNNLSLFNLWNQQSLSQIQYSMTCISVKCSVLLISVFDVWYWVIFTIFNLILINLSSWTTTQAHTTNPPINTPLSHLTLATPTHSPPPHASISPTHRTHRNTQLPRSILLLQHPTIHTQGQSRLWQKDRFLKVVAEQPTFQSIPHQIYLRRQHHQRH